MISHANLVECPLDSHVDITCLYHATKKSEGIHTFYTENHTIGSALLMLVLSQLLNKAKKIIAAHDFTVVACNYKMVPHS